MEPRDFHRFAAGRTARCGRRASICQIIA